MNCIRDSIQSPFMIGCWRNYLYVTFVFSRTRLPSARAGIRTRVSGMKTRDDGPGYTTRANDQPCHLLFITVGHRTLSHVFCFHLSNILPMIEQERQNRSCVNDSLVHAGRGGNEVFDCFHKTLRIRSFIVSWEKDLLLFNVIVRPITLLPRKENW